MPSLVPVAIGIAAGWYVLRGRSGNPVPLTNANLESMANTLCDSFGETPVPFQTTDGMARAIGRAAWPEIDWPPRPWATSAHKAVWTQIRAWVKSTQDAAAAAGYADVCEFLSMEGVAPPVPEPPDPGPGNLPPGWFMDEAGMYCTLDSDGDELCFSRDDLPADFYTTAPPLLGGSVAPKTTGGGGQAQPVSWDVGIFGGGDRPMNWHAVAAFLYAAGVTNSIPNPVDPNGPNCPEPGKGSRQSCNPSQRIRSFQAMWNTTQNWGDMLEASGYGGLHPLLRGPTLAKDGRLGANTLLAMSKVHEWQSKVDPGIARWRAVVYEPARQAGATS